MSKNFVYRASLISSFISLTYVWMAVSSKQTKSYHLRQQICALPRHKEVQYNCNAHRSAHLFLIAISSHSHIKRKQPQIIFLKYSCYVNTINIVKNSREGQFINKTPWLDLLVLVSHKHRMNISWKIAYWRITTGGCFRSFVMFFKQSFHFFRTYYPRTPILFDLNSFLWKGPLTVKAWICSMVKVRKKNHRSDFGLHQFLFWKCTFR